MENQYRIHSASHVRALHTILSGIFFYFYPAFYPTQHSFLFIFFFSLSIPYTPPPQVLSCPLLFRMPLAPHSFQYTHPPPYRPVWSGSLSSSGCEESRMRRGRGLEWTTGGFARSPPSQRMDLLKRGGGGGQWKSTDACHWSFPDRTGIEGGP